MPAGSQRRLSDDVEPKGEPGTMDGKKDTVTRTGTEAGTRTGVDTRTGMGARTGSGTGARIR